jgi:hypothetical protein
VHDAVTHLDSYQIKAVRGAPKFVRKHVKMTNQLAVPSIFYDLVKPDLLLVQTAKSLVPPPPALPGPNAVDHYKCYRAVVTKGTPKFPKGVTVTVADQFRTTAGTFTIKKAQHVCTPVSKDGSVVHNPDAHLVCYQTAIVRGQPKHVPVTVYVNNELGPQTLTTIKEDELCIPSLKTVLP